MNESSEFPRGRRSEEISTPGHVNAVANPSYSEFQRLLKYVGKKGATHLDIGVGADDPFCSWELTGEKDLWVGADPGIVVPRRGSHVTVYTGDSQIHKDAQLAVYNTKVEHIKIPPYYPHYTSVIAPNPEIIVDGGIFNDDLAHLILDPRGYSEQTLVYILDDRTWEARKHGKGARKVIKSWLRNNGFEIDDIPEHFNPLSADLDALNELNPIAYTRGG